LLQGSGFVILMVMVSVSHSQCCFGSAGTFDLVFLELLLLLNIFKGFCWACLELSFSTCYKSFLLGLHVCSQSLSSWTTCSKRAFSLDMAVTKQMSMCN
jgi:hypothetical protein